MEEMLEELAADGPWSGDLLPGALGVCREKSARRQI